MGVHTECNRIVHTECNQKHLWIKISDEGKHFNEINTEIQYVARKFRWVEAQVVLKKITRCN